MTAVLDSLLRVDLSRVSAEVREGLETGKMILSEALGTVYWATGSGSTGVVAHLPMIPVSPEELATAQQLLQVGQAVKAAQFASVATTAVAAAVVVAVVVVATAYLADKIDKVKGAVNDLAQAVDQQVQREYIKYGTDYIGALMAAKAVLNSNASDSEKAERAKTHIDVLARLRHQMLLFVGGLCSSESNDVRCMPFMIQVLDFVPAAIAIERELCLVAGMLGSVNDLQEKAAPDFRKQLAEFRVWCEKQYKQLAQGQASLATVQSEQRAALRALFNSPVHAILLGEWSSVKSTQKPAQAADADAQSELLRASDSVGQGRTG